MKKRFLLVLACLTLVCTLSACNFADFEFGGLLGDFLNGLEFGDVSDNVVPPEYLETNIEIDWATEEDTWGEVQTLPITDPDIVGTELQPCVKFEDPCINVACAVDTLQLYEIDTFGDTFYFYLAEVTEYYDSLGLSVEITYSEYTADELLIRAINAQRTGEVSNTIYYFPLNYAGAAFNHAPSFAYDLNKLPGYAPYASDINGEYSELSTIEGRQYSTVGALTPLARIEVECLAYNQELALSNGFDLYDLVRSGDWTWETYSKVVESARVDLNGDGRYTDEDAYGIVFDQGEATEFLLDNSGIRLFENGEYSALSDAYMAAILSFDTRGIQDAYVESDVSGAIFAKHGNIMLCPTTLSELARYRSGYLYDYSFDSYGVIPAPKYAVGAESYAASATKNSAIMMVSIACEPEAMGALLTNMELISQAYCVSNAESMTSYRVANSQESTEMVQLIMDSKHYDFDRIVLQDFGRYVDLLNARMMGTEVQLSYTEMYMYLSEHAYEQMINMN